MSDDDLLARLNALKPSTAPSLSQSDETKFDPEDELVNRFLRFRSISPAAEEAPGSSSHGPSAIDSTISNGEDGKTLKDLLADVPPDREWTVDAEDERNIEKLIAQAKRHLPTENGEQADGPRQDADLDEKQQTAEGKTTEEEASHKEEQSEDALADEYLQQILDELDLEEPPEDPRSQSEAVTEYSAEHDPQHPSDDPQSDTLVALPSAPADEPQVPTDADFSLPSAPVVAPSARKPKGEAVKKYTDEEIETWCIICCDDASVRCVGCDGDLYCDKCWREGHTGPDAGIEEKSHRALRFVNPKEQKKAQSSAA